MAHVTVAIVGLQRIGTSFGLAIKELSSRPNTKNTFTVIGYDTEGAAMRGAAKMNAVDSTEPALENAVQRADLVFLSAPYGEIDDLYEIMSPALKPGAVIVDASPIKSPSVALARKYFRRDSDGNAENYLVGVTTIINPEYLGAADQSQASARADLFENGLMILSPAADCPPEAVQLVTDMMELLGVRVHFTDPGEQDGMAASMEGLPTLLQLALFRTLAQREGWDDLRWAGNPRFFLATYMLSGGNAQEMGALTYRNRDNLTRKLDALIRELEDIRTVLAKDEEIDMAQLFRDAIKRYDDWQVSRITNKLAPSKTDDEMENMGGIGGMLTGMFVPFGLRKKKKDDGK
jgi:prephenate dehydrogenase